MPSSSLTKYTSTKYPVMIYFLHNGKNIDVI